MPRSAPMMSSALWMSSSSRGIGSGTSTNVEAVLPALEWRTWAVVLHWNESYGADVQPFEGPARAQPDGETALSAGKGLAVAADLEEPPVCDRQAEATVGV